MTIDNLRAMFQRADAVDLREGQLAYPRYHAVMRDLAERYGVPIEKVIAAFVALSPNNDYISNLRSLVSVLDGAQRGLPLHSIKVSTYNHCRDRAYAYVAQGQNFLEKAVGLKIRSFYRNVLNPSDHRYVTVDGHVVAAWRGKNLTMKEALVNGRKEYRQIETAIKSLAFDAFMLPNQYQAVLWFTRKRVFNIKAKLQHDFFLPSDDVWQTYQDINSIRPFK